MLSPICWGPAGMSKPLGTVRFFVGGIPKSTQTGSIRRLRRPGKKDRLIASRRNTDWSGHAREVATLEMLRLSQKPLVGPISLAVRIYMPRLKNMRGAPAYPAGGPDLDNALKGLKDAWQGVLYLSDRQVKRYHLIEKVWTEEGESPGLLVEVVPLG